MTNDNYARHLKVLGKLVFVYDTASAEATNHETYLATTFDQVATGSSVDNDAVALLAGHIAAWRLAITEGATSIKARMKSIVDSYLRSSLFRSDFVTGAPTAAMTAAQVAVLFDAEMTADSKTFTTAGATGLAHFFNTEYSTTMPDAGSPTYADGTYCVSTVV